MEQRRDGSDGGILKGTGIELFHCHLVNNKSHVDCAGDVAGDSFPLLTL